MEPPWRRDVAALLAAGGYPEAADIVRAAFESEGLPGGLPALLEWEEIAYAMRQVASGDPHPSVAGIKAGNFGGGSPVPTVAILLVALATVTLAAGWLPDRRKW